MECQNTGSLYASLSEEEKENKLIRIIIEEIQNDRQKNGKDKEDDRHI
ncbi:MAG TPA: hypothetical protein IAC64_09875 [Candidatus Caccomorpha excrementavium]|nr:hypothetical protein [Candidatus Caccomorpha excrementavium]